jgi:uncharacterized protein (TIGR02246 family)
MSRMKSDIRLLTDAQLDSVAGGYPPEPINGFRLWPPSRSPPVPSRTHNPAVPSRASKPFERVALSRKLRSLTGQAHGEATRYLRASKRSTNRRRVLLKHFSAVIMVGTLCASYPALAQQAVSDSDAKQAATTFTDAWDDAYNANKPAVIAALFTKDGVFLTGAGTMLTGQNQIETAVAARIQKGWTKETIRVIQAHPEGDVVLAVIDYEIAGTGANAGKQIGGYALDVLTHEGSGWRAKLISATLRPVKDVTGMTAATKQQ